MNASSRETAEVRASRVASDLPPAWAAAALLALAIGAVYGRALNVPFVFDDDAAIVSNESIASLWPLIGTAEHPGPLRPPAPRPTAGRPLVNLSFAINYYFGGSAPTGYHAVSVLIHFGSSLLLWAIVRRTLMLPYFAGRFETSASWLALAVALAWALHPLQTEAVIYATQRTELMMGLFYFATLYCSMRYWATLPLPPVQAPGERALVQIERSAASENPWCSTKWLMLAVLACLCGMASKEVMVTAPVMVLLFERTFISASLKNALRRSWPLYVGLASSWLLLLALNMNSPRGDSAGLGTGPPLTSWWLTQSQVVLMYLKLVVWPRPLLIHYLLPYLETFADSWTYVVPVILIGIITLALLWRNNPVGYLFTWVFVVLSPTLVIPIVTEVAAERRMYLPIAAIAAFVVIGGYLLTQSLSRGWAANWRSPVGLKRSLVIAATTTLLAIVLGSLSATRLSAYYDEMWLWQEVVESQPANYMAHYNLSLSLKNAGRYSEAIAELQSADRLKPREPGVLAALGQALANDGRWPEAIEALHAAVTLQPDFPIALNHLGFALTQLGQSSEAVKWLQRAIELKPDFADAHNNLGIALGNLGGFQEAIAEFQLALKYDKDNPKAHNNLGLALFKIGDKAEAIKQLELGLKLNPNDANSHYNLAAILVDSGRTDEAIAHNEEAIRLWPESPHAHNGLGDALRQKGRQREAIKQYEKALQLKPDFIDAYAGLTQALAQLQQLKEAIATALKGIEVARATGQTAAAEQLDECLKHYRIEMQRIADPASADSTLHAQPPTQTQ